VIHTPSSKPNIVGLKRLVYFELFESKNFHFFQMARNSTTPIGRICVRSLVFYFL